MKNNEQLELAQIAWVVPDIHQAVAFFSTSLGLIFETPQYSRARDFNMKYRGKVVDADWYTTQAHNGVAFVELIQPLSGESMFEDYLKEHPEGGVQHIAYRLPVAGYERVVSRFVEEGYELIGEVDHPIARMSFFDTYKTLGIVTEIMGITPDGWTMIRQMEKAG